MLRSVWQHNSLLFRSPLLRTRSAFPIINNRSYCDAAEDEEDDLPQGEEWVMLRQAKKTTKKRLEARRKQAKGWRNIAFQAWTNMYKPEHAKEILRSLKKQSKYDDVVLTPKHGERFFRVYRARQIQEQNQARDLGCFPRRR